MFSDPHYREELARSSRRYTEDEFVTVTTSDEILYVEVRGRHRSSGTPFTLTVAAHDRLRDQGSEQEPLEVPVDQEVAAQVGGDRSFYFFTSTPGGHYTIKLLSPTMDVDLYAHGDDFTVVQDTSDNLRVEDEALSVTATGDRFSFSVDGSHTHGSGANYDLHVLEETFDNEGDDHDPLPITGTRHRGQVQAEGTARARTWRPGRGRPRNSCSAPRSISPRRAARRANRASPCGADAPRERPRRPVA